MNTIKAFRRLALPLVLVLAVSCGGQLNPESIILGDWSGQYCDEPTSALLTTITSGAGDVLNVFADKKKDGTPTSVIGFEVTRAGEENPTVFQVSNGVITSIETPNAVRMNINWLSDEEMALIMLEPNTGEQLYTTFNVNETQAPATTPDNPGSFFEAVNPRAGELVMAVQPHSAERFVPQVVSTKADNEEKPDIEGTIYTTKCGVPAWLECYVDVYASDYGQRGKYLGRFWGEAQDKGVYHYTIPGETQPHHDPSAYIAYIETVCAYLCHVNEQGINTYFKDPAEKNRYIMMVVCPTIGSYIASAGVTVAAGAGFTAGCAAVMAAFDFYCNTLGQGAPGGDSVAARINQALDIKWDDDLLLYPYINVVQTADSRLVSGKRGMYSKGGKGPDLYLEFSDANMYVYPTPWSPSEGQDYVVTIDIDCVQAGSSVKASVTGSDGYTDSKEKKFTKGSEKETVTLTVPGAEKGVHDRVDVNFILPDGSNIFRWVDISFK